MPKRKKVARWLAFEEACQSFVVAKTSTQGSEHIEGVHWYVASRLVLEGGFDPNFISPRPPFRVVKKRGAYILTYDEKLATGTEATVLGGLKTKKIDVVVNVPTLGPALAVSMKGTLNAYRNLTNRLEEAVGDCTNIHIAYPPLVYGFLHLLRANRPGPMPKNAPFEDDPKRPGLIRANDIALTQSGGLSENLVKYRAAMERLTGRKDIRNDVSRYEAVAFLLLSGEDGEEGQVVEPAGGWPESVRFDNFFTTLYQRYDLRFVFGAPNLAMSTRRLVWDETSPVLSDERIKGFNVRIGDPINDDERPNNDHPDND